MMRWTIGVLTCLCAATMVYGGDSWPDFRGPTHNGHADASQLPLTWSETQNVKWKTAIHGRAWSSPVVMGDQVWLTTATEDGRELFVVCVDLNTGKVLLDRKLFDVAEPQFAHHFNTYASPSPTIEPGRVYVTFGSPGTACLDTKTFEVIWQRTDFECNHFRGAGSSPVLFEDLLLMHFDGSDHQFVVGLDKKTGDTKWLTKRSIDYMDIDPKTGKPEADGDWRKAFSTPFVAEFDGKPVMLSLGSKALYAYDPRTGSELWRTEERTNHSGSSRPVVGGGLIYSPTGLPRPQLWAIRPGGSGVVNDTHVQWIVPRNVPQKPSILLVNDLLFMVDDGGIVTCLEAKTGKDVWRQRVKGKHSASPIYAAGRIYLFSEDGPVSVIEAGPTFKLLAENVLDEGFMASPAVIGRSLIIRTRTHLYRIEE